jgi:transposase-like protein
MTCLRCQHGTAKRFGYYSKRRVQRWRCNSCHATFTDPATAKLLDGHYTDLARIAQALSMGQVNVLPLHHGPCQNLTGSPRNTSPRVTTRL